MPSAQVQKGIVIENSSCVLMARIVNESGEPLTQSEVDSLTCKVFDSEEAQLVNSPTLDVTDCIFDDPQSNPAWPYKDGFNFRVVLNGANFPLGGRMYAVEIKVSPQSDEYQSGDDFYVVWHLQSLELLSA